MKRNQMCLKTKNIVNRSFLYLEIKKKESSIAKTGY